MKYARAVAGLCRSLAADSSGNVAMLVAACIFVLVGAMGLAIDVGRAQIVESKLLNAADAAGLAIGARLNTATANDEAEKFVNVNFPHGYAGATISSVDVDISADEAVIVVTASASLPTTFMKLFGFETLDVGVTSEVTRRTTGLELALVLDVTGSMQPHISDLKNASLVLLDILYGDAAVSDELFVGIVPFSQAVNVGASRTAWIDASDMDAKDWGPATWQGCVEARGNGRDTTDDPPGDLELKAYYYRDTTMASNDYQTYNEWRYDSGGMQYRTPFAETRGPNGYCPASVITPMTPEKLQVVEAIDDLAAVGGTHIPVGAAWGWRMLSPRWRGLWGGDMATHDLPLEYDAVDMEKAMVIMTDGDNTMYGSDFYGAYGRLSDGNLGTTSSIWSAENELDYKVLEICTGMKNAGIRIYTVAFNNPSGSTKDMMQACASQVDYYFDSPSAADLETAFKTIGDSLTTLRVSR